MKKYYEILQVHPKASTEVIEKAYRVLIKKYHPDMQSNGDNPESDKMARDINEAYKILSEPFLREQYDAELQREEEEDSFRKSKQVNIYETNREDRPNQRRRIFNNNQKNQEYVRDMGTFGSVFRYFSQIFKKGKDAKFEKPGKEGLLAIGLTIVIMTILCLLLWFIPFTNTAIRWLFF